MWTGHFCITPPSRGEKLGYLYSFPHWSAVEGCSGWGTRSLSLLDTTGQRKPSKGKELQVLAGGSWAGGTKVVRAKRIWVGHCISSLTPAIMWMNPEDITLSEINQSQMDKYYMIPFI